MGNPFVRFENWRKSTYLSVAPIFGAGSGGDLMQVGPLAILSSLFDKEEKSTNDKTKSSKVERPKPVNQEYYAYQDERFDLVIHDWGSNKTDFFDEEFVTGLGQLIKGYIADPLNEKDHAWAGI